MWGYFPSKRRWAIVEHAFPRGASGPRLQNKAPQRGTPTSKDRSPVRSVLVRRKVGKDPGSHGSHGSRHVYMTSGFLFVHFSRRVLNTTEEP